jgi:HAD superfamily hydrolase (TIGR01490 family)
MAKPSGGQSSGGELSAAAFFDLDRTLMAGSSAYHFGRAVYKAGGLSRAQLARDALEQIRFRLQGSTDAAVNALMDRVMAAIKDTPVSELAHMRPDAIAGILPRIYPQMLEVVREHQDAGRACYIVSAASNEIVQVLAVVVAMDGAIGTVSEIRDGVYTGKLGGPFVYGEGKARAMREFAAERGIDLSGSWAYSDSASDLPMLEAVGHPVAVNPDAELAGVARREGWEVLRFERLGQRLRVALTVLMAAAVGGTGTWLAAYRRARREPPPLHRRAFRG